MIRSFSDREAERIWGGQRSRKLPSDIQDRALNKLRLLSRARVVDDLASPPANRLDALRTTAPGSTPFQLTTNGVYASSRKTVTPMMSRSPTTTADPEWLHNSHAGELLSVEFMEPVSLDAATLALAIDVPCSTIEAVVSGDRQMDGALDLRLARYFSMSEGFFLGLQTDYELLEAKRRLNGALDRIVPRAA